MRVMEIGLNAAVPEIYPAMAESMRGLVDPDAPDSIVKLPVQKAVETRLSDAAAAAEAAILLFGHTVLDSVTADLCEIIADIAPELWEDALRDRKVSLKDLKESGSYAATLRSLLRSHLSELERKSLIERIRLITQKCFPGGQPLPVFESMWGGDFKLDLKRIEAIDHRRQDVIHRAEFDKRSDEFEDDLEYCELTVTYLVKIISIRFGIPVGDGMYGPGVEKLTIKATGSGGGDVA